MARCGLHSKFDPWLDRPGQLPRTRWGAAVLIGRGLTAPRFFETEETAPFVEKQNCEVARLLLVLSSDALSADAGYRSPSEGRCRHRWSILLAAQRGIVVKAA